MVIYSIPILRCYSMCIYIYLQKYICQKSCRFLFQSRNDVHLLHIHATAKEVGSYKDPLFEGLTSIVTTRMVLGGSSRAWFHMNHIRDSDFTTFNFEHHTFWTHVFVYCLERLQAFDSRGFGSDIITLLGLADVVSAVREIVRGVLPVFLVFLVFDDLIFLQVDAKTYVVHHCSTLEPSFFCVSEGITDEEGLAFWVFWQMELKEITRTQSDFPKLSAALCAKALGSGCRVIEGNEWSCQPSTMKICLVHA